MWKSKEGQTFRACNVLMPRSELWENWTWETERKGWTDRIKLFDTVAHLNILGTQSLKPDFGGVFGKASECIKKAHKYDHDIKQIIKELKR